VSSDYYRIVQIPEAYFGLISAASSLAGMATAALMERMLKKRSADYNFVFLAMMIFISFIGVTFRIPHWGILFVLPFGIGMRFLQFFLSYYINRVTHSSRRATALSFKGLAMNLGYGALNIGYALQARYLGAQGVGREEQLGEAIQIWPWVFLVFLILFAIVYRATTRKSLEAKV
jgi:cyanate permease